MLRWVRLLNVLVLRAAVLLLAVQVSGASQAFQDVVASSSDTCDGCDGCDDEDCPCGPTDCPPGCPGCHGHGVAGLPRRFEAVSLAVPLASWLEARPAAEVSLPVSPDLAGPFRPPQHA